MAKCTICNHPEKDRIESMLRNGIFMEQIARDVPGLTVRMLQNHRDKHMRPLARKQRQVAMSPAIPHDIAASEAANGDIDVGAGLYNLLTRCEGILNRCEASGDTRNEIAGVREVRSLLELQLKKTGALQSGTSINITMADRAFVGSKEFQSFLDFLSLKHPELREEFAMELRAKRAKEVKDVVEGAGITVGSEPA